MARTLASEHSYAAGFPLETSFSRPHQFCKLLPSIQLATISGPGKMFSETIAGTVRIRLQHWRMRFGKAQLLLTDGMRMPVSDAMRYAPKSSTRSITPEISSVAGLRSGIEAFHVGIHFSTGGLR
jgi:hypothetical protein